LSWGVVSAISLAISVACAGLLGIEDATCDPEFDQRCVTFQPLTLLPAGTAGSTSAAGGGGVSGAAGAAGAAGSSAGNTTGGVAGAGGSAPSETEDEPELTLCDRYCDTIAEACPEPYQQYTTPAACRAVCAKLPPGQPGERSVNTVECRLARAELARDTGEPGPYCFSAGPGGASVCGTDCDGYCSIMTQACPQLLGVMEECLAACERVPNVSDPPDNTPYEISVQAGNSIQCRLFHVSAATVDAVMHCGHAAGSTPCVDEP
jgi:hypothetical protein